MQILNANQIVEVSGGISPEMASMAIAASVLMVGATVNFATGFIPVFPNGYAAVAAGTVAAFFTASAVI